MVNLTWIGDRVLNENELALIENALVCYEQQLRVDEGEARERVRRLGKMANEETLAMLNRLAETHADTQRRVLKLLETIG